MSTFTLPFPPSTNNLFINVKHGRIRSQQYDEWILEAGHLLNRQKPPTFAGPVALLFEFVKPDERKRDVTNFIKAPEDLLVRHGIIEADDDSIVKDVRAKWDETNTVAGVRVTVASFIACGGKSDARAA